jgi:hypothetical protein
MNKPKIQTAIHAILAERNASARTHVIAVEGEFKLTAGRTLEELCHLAFSDITEMFEQHGSDVVMKPLNQIPVGLRRSIRSVKIRRYMEGTGDEALPVQVLEFTLYDKNRAIETLAKHLGLLRERTPIEDFLNIIASLNPDYAAKVRSLLIERFTAQRRNRLPPRSGN